MINLQAGEIVFWTYIWYQDMADFAERISDGRAGRRLARAIDGRGAFRRFKAEPISVWYDDFRLHATIPSTEG